MMWVDYGYVLWGEVSKGKSSMFNGVGGDAVSSGASRTLPGLLLHGEEQPFNKMHREVDGQVLLAHGTAGRPCLLVNTLHLQA